MKKLLFLGLLLLNVQVFASDKGNGGGGHVCGENVELYDFYEGRNPILHGIQVWETDSTLSMEEYIVKAMTHLKSDVPALGQYIEKRVKDLLTIPYKEIVLPVIIPRTLDADIPMIEEGCEFKQVASWNERFAKIFFSRSVFEKMDNKSKAGLYVHEVLYKIARESGLGQNSNGVRMLVAQIFSDMKIKESDLEEHILPQGTILFLPKKGMCELGLKVEREKFVDISFGISGKGFIRKDEKMSIPCEDVYQKDLKLVLFGDAREISPLINGKKLRRSVMEQLVWDYRSSSFGRLIVIVKPEKIYFID